MGMWYVQTWMVLPGKYKEHEELLERLRPPLRKRGKIFRYFDKWFGPLGVRVFILEFDSLADLEQFFNTFYKEEEIMKLQEEWLTYIDPSSLQGAVWGERKVE